MSSDTSKDDTVTAGVASRDLSALSKEAETTSLSIESITEPCEDSIIPKVKFVEDISTFASSFSPPASAELMIGAFSDLFGKLKTVEANLGQKRTLFQQKIPDIEKSLTLVTHLKKKHDEGETITTRYNLADMVYAKAEVDSSAAIVHLWLGANVMLEYSYEEAIDLLSSKLTKAKKELEKTTSDLAFVRNQIITAEVIISRIYNWDVRQKRLAMTKEDK